MSRQAGAASQFGLDRFAYSRSSSRGEGAFGLDVAKIPILSSILSKDKSLAETANKLLGCCKAGGTVKNYEATVKKFKSFCNKESYSRTDFDEKAVLHYILKLTKDNASLGILCQLKPALTLVERLSGSKGTAFTDTVDTFLNAAKRRAAEKKPIVKKAPTLPLDILK